MRTQRVQGDRDETAARCPCRYPPDAVQSTDAVRRQLLGRHVAAYHIDRDASSDRFGEQLTDGVLCVLDVKRVVQCQRGVAARMRPSRLRVGLEHDTKAPPWIALGADLSKCL